MGLYKTATATNPKTATAASAKFANDSWLVTRWTSRNPPFASTRKRPHCRLSRAPYSHASQSQLCAVDFDALEFCFESIAAVGINTAGPVTLINTSGLQPDTLEQNELDFGDGDAQDRGRLMDSMDELNSRFGRGTVMLASAGIRGDKRAFSMKQERRTNCYTTCLADMPTVRA